MIKKVISNLFDKLPDIKIGQPIMKIILAVIFIYLMLIMLFISGLFFNAWKLSKVDLNSIIEMIRVLTGPSAIAAITFLGKAFIDANGNGIPDAFEDGSKQIPGPDRPIERKRD